MEPPFADSAQPARRTAVVAVSGLLALAHALLLARRLDRRVLGRAAAAMAAQLRAAAGCCPGRRRPERDPFAEEVRRLEDEQRMRLAWSMLTAGSCLSQIVVLGNMINILSGAPEWFSVTNEIVMLVSFAGFLAPHLRPTIFRIETLHIWFSMFMAMACISMAPFALFREAVPTNSEVIMVMRGVVGCICGSIPLLIFWNVAFMVTAIGSYVWQESNCVLVSNTGFVMAECLGTLCLVMALWVIKSHMHALAAKDVEVKTSRQERTAASALINTMSDAVVELDAELCIVEHSSKMADMLLHGPGHSLAGVEFEQLVASEADRQLFRDHMGWADSTQTMANVFHLELHDSLSNRIAVETFHVCIASPCESVRHLIGVREFNENNTVRMPVPPQDAMLAQPIPMLAAGRLPDGPGAEVSVKFDAFTFLVTECSDAFSRMCGHSPIGGSFQDWLPEFHQPESKAMQHYTACVNEFVNEEFGTMSLTFRNLLIRSPYRAPGTDELLATCMIVLTAPSEDDIRAEAILTEVRQKEQGTLHGALRFSRRRRAQSRGSRSSRSASSVGSSGRSRGRPLSRGSRPGGSERGQIGKAVLSV